MREWRDFVGLLPEGLMIAVFTMLGYISAYFFHMGFLDRWTISYLFIDVGITGVLFGVCMTSSFLLGPIWVFFWPFGLPGARNFFRKYGISIMGLVLWGLVALLYALRMRVVVGIGPLGFISVTFYAFVSILYHIFSYRFVLIGQGLVVWRNEFRSEIESIRRAVSIGELIVYIAAAVFLVPYLVGALTARGQEVFPVTDTSPEMVVLYKSGDNLICAPFDRTTKKVHKRFTILRLDKESMPVLSPQKVGPLSVVE